MKKIIAAAAGLMLTATMISTASAAIEFSGDARARYYYQDKYTNDTNGQDFWNNRVRLKVKGTTEGGSYAVTRFTVNNSPWGTSNFIGDTASFDVTADWAYVGVPMGCVELTAGRQPLNLTTGFFNDAGVDNVRLTYKNEGTTLVGLYAVAMQTFDNNVLTGDDDEIGLWAFAWMQDWDGWNTTLGLAFFNDNVYSSAGSDAITGDNVSGVVAAFNAKGKAGAVDLEFELGYQEDGYAGHDNLGAVDATGDDGWGAFLSAGMDFTDQFSATLLTGFTVDGYTFDVPVGFIMIGGDNQITPSQSGNIGAFAGTAYDTYFIGVKTNYQASDDLGFNFNLAYANLDGVNFNENEIDLFEISAQAVYTINEGTALKARAGYVSYDDDYRNSNYDDAFGFGVSLELNF